MAKSWGKTKAPGNNGKKQKIEDIVDLLEFGENYTSIRLVGPVTSVGTHWITIKTKEKGKMDIPKICLNYNPDTEDFEENGCPYCEAGVGRFSTNYYTNVISREIQEAQPARLFPPMASEKKIHNIGSKEEPFKVRLKEKGSKTWTPIRIARLPPTVASKLVEISKTNRHLVKNKKTGKKVEDTFDLAHEKYGIDIEVNLKKGGSSGYGQYDVQKGRRTPLSEEELNYLFWTLNLAKPETLKEATNEWKKLKKQLVDKVDSDDDDEDDKSVGKKGKKKRDVFEDDDDDMPKRKSRNRDDDDEDEDRPRKKKKRDAFADLDDEIERASKKKKKKSGSTSKKSKSKTKKRR